MAPFSHRIQLRAERDFYPARFSLASLSAGRFVTPRVRTYNLRVVIQTVMSRFRDAARAITHAAVHVVSRVLSGATGAQTETDAGGHRRRCNHEERQRRRRRLFA